MIDDVIDKVAADFAAESVPADVLLGKEFLAENVEPWPRGRVVFIPTDDSFTPAKYVQLAAAGDEGQNPRPIMTRVCGCDVHIWAAATILTGVNARHQLRADFAALNALINQTVLSIWRACQGPNNRITSGTNNNRVQHVHRGLVYVLQFTVEVPITDGPWPNPVGTPADTFTEESNVVQATTVQQINPDGSIVLAVGPI